ncbi:MAG: efflux RND transporter periplasmic adaptor subunit [Chloroflexi bacterium]|nr:MAG: efflux RND transporter periplasmic adaptor subunit [Chloroflexota bacterium]RLT52473.1 MAG: efflux RND transporter periplasmic adaptor subunit [Chloroflexota bacterium]
MAISKISSMRTPPRWKEVPVDSFDQSDQPVPRYRKPSMNNSLRRPHRQAVLVGTIAMFLVACGGGTPAPVAGGGQAGAPGAPAGSGASGQAQGIPVTVQKVVRDSIEVKSPYGGSIAPKAQVTILPRVAGRIVRTAAETGSVVQAGDLLAELDHATLDAQIAQARANVAGAVANVAAATARLDIIKAGAKPDDVAASQAAVDLARVRLDQALAGVRDEDLRAAIASADSARTRLEAGRTGRQEDLQAAQAAVDAAKIRLDAGRAGGRPEDVQAAKATLDAARNRLAQVEAGTRAEDIRASEADLQTAKIRLTQLQNPRAEDIATAQVALDQARTRLSQAREGGIGTGITARARPEDLNTLELRVQAAQAALDKANADLAKGPTSTVTSQALNLASTQAQINVLTAQNDLSKARAVGGPTDWDLRLLEEAEQVARASFEKVSNPSPNDIAAAQVAVEKAQAALEKLKTVTPFDIETARQSVVQAQANLDKAVNPDPSTVAQLETAYATAVATLQKTIVPDPATVAQLESAYVTALTVLEKLQKPLPYDVDAARATLAQSEAQLSARRNPYTEFDRAAAEAAVRQAEAALAQQQAALELQTVNLAETQITAPFDGIVAERLATAGAVVQVSTPVFTLISRDTEIALNVEEAAISRFREGGNASFSVNAYPSETFQGSVTSIFPTGDSRSRTFTVKVKPADPTGKLKPGMYAQLSVTLDSRTNVTVVPRDAILLRNDKPFIFVINENVAALRPLELGLGDDRKVEVKTGVQPDESIVISGQATLRDKDAVRIVTPGAPGGGAGGQGGPGSQRPTGAPGQGASGGAGGQGAPGGAAPADGSGGGQRPAGGQGGAPADAAGGGQRPAGGAGSAGQGAAPADGAGGGQRPAGGSGAGGAGGQRPSGAAGQGAAAQVTPTKAP